MPLGMCCSCPAAGRRPPAERQLQEGWTGLPHSRFLPVLVWEVTYLWAPMLLTSRGGGEKKEKITNISVYEPFYKTKSCFV